MMDEYSEPALGDPEGLAKAIRWMRWARHELQELHNAKETAAKLGEVVRKRDAELETVLRVARRDAAVKYFDIGSQVLIVALGIPGTVSGVFIDRAGVKYWVRWWRETEPVEKLLHNDEVDVYDDALSPRQEG